MKSVYREKNKKSIDLNLTSMIDVIFLLLIFFIFTTNFDKIEKMLPADLSLPGAIDSPVRTVLADPVKTENIHVRIVGAGEKTVWSVNRRICRSLPEIHNVLEQLAKIDPDIPVIIDPEKSVPIEKLIDVYDLCRKAGLMKIQFAASPRSAEQENHR
ncbi:MAG: biopolymer transporter ExbD [Planctomycetia bacterium]|nr:biopolymer transporter ExbD [Planctomycetia bacterium]